MGREGLGSKLISVIDLASRMWHGVPANGDLDQDGYLVDGHNPMFHRPDATSAADPYFHGPFVQNRAGLAALGLDESDVHSFADRAKPWLAGIGSLVVLSGLFFVWKAGMQYKLGQTQKPTPIADAKVGRELAQTGLADNTKGEMRNPLPDARLSSDPYLFASSAPVPLITAPRSYQPPVRRPPVSWSGGTLTRTGRVTLAEDIWSDAVREYTAQLGIQGAPVD